MKQLIAWGAGWAAVLALAAGGCHSLAGERIYPDAGSDADTDTDADADGTTEGTLIAGTHHTVLEYLDGEEAGIFWLPLPADHATQVPLYVELTFDPAEIVAAVEYDLDEQLNFGAFVELAASGSAEQVDAHWEAIVMTRDVSSQERPDYYAAIGDPEDWTAASALADSSHSGIADTAASVTAGESAAVDKMAAIIEWTSSNIEYPTDWTDVDSLDATTAYELGQSSSTGFANLATALGRAAGLPTRTLADIYVGQSQQTHYMNEFYLGSELGWRRVEPQATVTVLIEEYALTLRVVDLADEDAAALSEDLWSFPGTPLYCQVQPEQGAERMIFDYTPDYFDDCAACDNRAEVSAALSAPTPLMTEVFDRARELWQRDLQAYLDGTLDAAIMNARRDALDADDLTDVIAILDQIE